MATYNYVGSTNLLYVLNKLKAVLDAGYVAQISGKGLSTNDFTNELKTLLESVQSGAEANVQSDWSVTDSTSDAYIANKPTNLVQDENYVHTDVNFTTALKTKLDGISESADAVSATQVQSTGTKIATITINGNDVDIYAPPQTQITIDSEMSATSENPVQNKVIKSYVDSAVGSITGIAFEIVQTLPQTGRTGTIYLVSHGGTTPNIYDEYIWLSSSETFEKIGTTDIDLSGYVQDSDLSELTTTSIDTMFDTVWPSGD